MQYSVKTLLLISGLVAVAISVPVKHHFTQSYEKNLEREIGWGSPVCGQFAGGAESFIQKYDNARCLSVFQKYEHREDWVGDRIACAAMYHLALRKNADGLKLCHQRLNSKNSRRQKCAIYGILAYYDLSEDIHATQDFGEVPLDDFDVDSTEDVYLIGTIICSDFHYGNAPHEIIDSWGSPERLIESWITSTVNSVPKSYCTYDDMIRAIEKIDARAAFHFGEVINILKDCNAKPTPEQWEIIGAHQNKISKILDPDAVLGYLARNADYFASNKALRSIRDLKQSL